MKRKRCAHGRLKHKIGRRVCKKARSSKRSGKRRARRSGRGRKVAGISLGLAGVMAIGAVGAYTYLKSTGA